MLKVSRSKLNDEIACCDRILDHNFARNIKTFKDNSYSILIQTRHLRTIFIQAMHLLNKIGFYALAKKE